MLKAAKLLNEILAAIADLRPKFAVERDERTFGELCHELLARNEDVAGRTIGPVILGKYGNLTEKQKLEFFTYLAEHLDLITIEIEKAAKEYCRDKSAEALERLLKVAEPPRQELLRRLNQVPHGTEALVSMRQDLLRLAKSHPSLLRVDLDFKHLLASWFNRGFLEIRRISWQTPASALAKIIQYEAVHQINDWDDLRRRLQPEDRRCYAFFHPAMPDEPLVFVEVALCKGIPNSVQGVLSVDRTPLETRLTDTAVFYSISNCQTGLRGITFGNSLIKQVAADLSADLPNIKRFITLSPVPGFAKWLETDESNVSEGERAWLRGSCNRLLDNDDMSALEAASPSLKILAAKYLANPSIIRPKAGLVR